MINIELLAKIKAEIKRLKEEHIAHGKCYCEYEKGYLQGKKDEDEHILSFLSTLEEPVCEELEEEIARFNKEAGIDAYLYGEFPIETLTKIARHFTNWQKSQMMKNAINAEICSAGLFSPMINFNDKRVDGIKFGDKVKLILVKEDEK